MHREGKILNVEIDNPPINLITIPLLLDFINLTKWAQDDEESTVLVLRSNVEGFFIAHFDVEALLSMDSGGANTNSSVTSFDELCLRFQKMNKVTICVIEGRVGGGGSEIAMACDLRFAATETAVMNQMEVPIGIIPGGGGTQRLPELVGYSRALELIVGGLDLDATTGEKWGYFNRALPERELDEYMKKLLNRIASFNTESVRSAKEALQLTRPDLVPGLIAENTLFNDRNYSDSGTELMQRFLQLGGQTKDQESRIEEFALEVAKGEIDSENNNVIVGPKEFLSCNKIKISECNWLIDLYQDTEFKVLVKLRNSSQPVIGTIKVNLDNSLAYLTFDKPQFGVSTGQAAVFYNIKESSHILGGGWIKEAPNKSIDIKFYNA